LQNLSSHRGRWKLGQSSWWTRGAPYSRTGSPPALTCSAGIAFTAAAEAQQPRKIVRIGYLSATSVPDTNIWNFRQGKILSPLTTEKRRQRPADRSQMTSCSISSCCYFRPAPTRGDSERNNVDPGIARSSSDPEITAKLARPRSDSMNTNPRAKWRPLALSCAATIVSD
jgi:hypothetical protein